MRVVIRFIEAISENVGLTVCWGCVALTMLLSFEVFMRYVLNAPTIWSYEAATMLGCTIIALGWAYTHLHKGHVRIDVFYVHLSARGKAIVDAVCTVLLFFPLALFYIYVAADRTLLSLSLNEKLTESFWYPPAWPVRAIFFAGWFFFCLQGLATFIRDLYLAVRGKEL